MTSKWNIDNKRRRQRRMVKFFRLSVSGLLGIAGAFLLITQLVPLTRSYLKSKAIEVGQKNLLSPVPGAYRREIGNEFAYWDPGESYFNNLISQASTLTTRTIESYNNLPTNRKPPVIDQNYSKNMQLSIPELGINEINVTSNVESYDEDVYNLILKKGLAHFKGTSLPGGGGNTFIYGHSAVESYFTRHQNNPETIFTKLEEISIGDKVIIKKDGVAYTYIVRKKKVVEPDDFSILGSSTYKETVTLMTCTPIGIGTDRLIVIGELIDGS